MMAHTQTLSPLAIMARRATAAIAVMLLASCASTHGLHTHAQPIDPTQLNVAHSLSSVSFSAAAWPKAAWWTGFGDKQLDQLMSAALNAQPSLRIAEARVRQAQAAAGNAESSQYPQVNGSLKSTRERFSAHSTIPAPLAGQWDSFNDSSLGVSYELDFWGKNRATVNAALDRAHAAEVDLQAAHLILTTTLARTYLRLDSAYAQRDLAQDTLRQRAKTLELTRQRVATQIDSQVELTQAEAAMPATRERIASINESIALINNQIAALEGKGPDAGLTIQRPRLVNVSPVQLPSALPVDLIGRRPDIVAGRWRVEAASQDIKVAKAQFYPNISLSAFIGLQSLGFDQFLTAGSRVTGIGPAVSLPIFEGGRLRSNLGAQQAEYDAAVEKYNASLITAIHDVVDQLVSLHWLDEQQHEQAEALQLTQRAYDLALSRYHSGIANYLQVLSAQGQLLSQKKLVIASQARARELRLNLIQALGGGYAPPASPKPDLPRKS